MPRPGFGHRTAASALVGGGRNAQLLCVIPARKSRPDRQNSLSCALCCAALSLKNNSNQRICGPQKPQEKAPPMTGILQNYLPLVDFIGVASMIGLALLIAPFLVAFQSPDPEKLSAYECGFNAFDDARMKFDVRFYLVAIQLHARVVESVESAFIGGELFRIRRLERHQER